MLTESIAKRYAKAIFTIAIERQALVQVSVELNRIVEIFNSQKDFREVLVSPCKPSAIKKKLFSALFPQIYEMARNFIFLLIDKRREFLLPEVAQQYKQLMDEYQKIQLVFVYAAFPVPNVVLEDLKRSIENSLQKKITLNVRLDPELLGGLVIQIGDTRIDGSIKAKLEQLRDHLVGLSA